MNEPIIDFVVQVAIAFALGWIVGYERLFNGRAAGTQVYCLVSMASCALTMISGYPLLWYGGMTQAPTSDPTRIVGSILTGIGFLGAGIIVKSGTNVRGLTTAASIWSSSAIGILVGVGFSASAAVLTVLFVTCMTAVPRFERLLPANTAITVDVTYREGHEPNEDAVVEFLARHGMTLLNDSFSIRYDGKRFEHQFTIRAGSLVSSAALAKISRELPRLPHLESFTVAPSRRA